MTTPVIASFNVHCLACGDLFDAQNFDSPCLSCGPGTDCEVMALLPEFEKYDIQYPGDWRRIMQLHELSTSTLDELRPSYDDMLDECNPEIKIGTLTYCPSQVLKDCDPIAYRIGFDEYLDMDFTEHPYLPGQYIRTDEFEDAA